ncbi:MAG: sialidase, partial [Pedobacter sp.]
MLKRKIYITLSLVFAVAITANAQLEKWQKGIVKQEFLYDKAPFPSCHSATIVETPTGLVASYFGGTKERDPDVEIY